MRVGDCLQGHHEALSRTDDLTTGLFKPWKPGISHLGLLLISLHAMVVSADTMHTRCDAPPVWVGDAATITCHFNSSIQNEARFSVDRYSLSASPTGGRDTVLRCDKHHGKFECNKIKAGYQYQYSPTQTTSIKITIPTAGVEHVGRYVCMTVGQQEIDSCIFTLKDVKRTPTTVSPETTTRGMLGDNTTTERDLKGGNGGLNKAVYIVIGVLAVPVFVGITAFCLRKRLIRHIRCLPCFKGNTEGTQDHTQGANLPLRPTGVPPEAAEQRSEVTASDESEHEKLHHSDAKSNGD